MLPCDVASLILEGHIAATKDLTDVDGFLVELQLNYKGLMALGAYRGWKRDKHAGRRKVGCFDFKIFRVSATEAIPMVHSTVISDAGRSLEPEVVEMVFEGKDPETLGLSDAETESAVEVQLAMLEQEVNWGDEAFQSWTRFPPSEGKRPRDFITAYLRRIFVEPDFMERIERRIAASGTRGVLPPPVGKKEWGPHLEPEDSKYNPWLHGRLLEEFRSATESMPDNPQYSSVYRD